MTLTRKHISLPDDACKLLQELTEVCGMDSSMCITQLLRRHSCDIQNLFAINVVNRGQSCADLTTIEISVPLSTAPIVPQYESTSVSIPNLEASPKPVSPCDAFLAMDF